MAHIKCFLSAMIVCCLLASCGDSPEVIAAKKAEAEAVAKQAEEKAAIKKEEAEVKDTVTRALRDPDSAKFGDIFKGEWVSYKRNGISVKQRMYCVTVNAKNSFGGYTGDRQVLVATVIAEGISGSSVIPLNDNSLTVGECRFVISEHEKRAKK